MSKRLQVILSDSAFEQVEKTYKASVEGHPTVKLNYSDVVEMMILNSKVHVADIRLKHTDLRKTLMDLAKRKDLSVEEIISSMAELKGVLGKKESKKLLKAEAETEQ